MAGLMLNEDNSHFFSSRTSGEMNVEGLKRLVDHYAGPQVKEILFCPNAMRTSFASAVWQPIWEGYDPEKGDDQPFFQGPSCMENVQSARRWVDNALRLHRQGIDPYQVWLEHARSKGKSAWLSMRMNDLHDVDNPDSFMHSDLWKQRPDLRRVTYRKMLRWTDAAFDYGESEVREYHLRLICEYFDRYDMDGLELDWMRFGFHFRPGKEAEGREILTGFIGQVRELAGQASARRNRRIEIGVRVPSRPQAARGLGMDAVEWARRGLVDRIVVTPFWATIEPDMPVELWKALLDGTRVQVAAGLELLVRPFPEAGVLYNTAEMVRGAAASLLYRGAERIYLFNYMDSHTAMSDADQFQEILRQAGELETACAHPRRHVVTYSDTYSPGQPAAPPLPVSCSRDRLAEFRVHIGPRPQQGSAWAIIGLGAQGNTDPGGLELWVNGEPGRQVDAPQLPASPVVQKLVLFEIPVEALQEGYNLVEVLESGSESRELVWVEIRIQPSASRT